jgi:hypothetical protein
MDVVLAFLYAELKEKIHMEQPEGHEQRGPNGERMVWRLKKSLYGLKQAPHNWFKVFDDALQKLGFTPLKSDRCVYIKSIDGKTLIVVLYVDDLMLLGNNRAMMDEFKQSISAQFDMKDLGELKWILGMEVKQDKANGVIELSQAVNIEQLLKKNNMMGGPIKSVPMSVHLEKGPPMKYDPVYSSWVGSIIYLARGTRPDIAYVASFLARFCHCATALHYTAMMDLFRYLLGTMHYSLRYTRSRPDVKLTGYDRQLMSSASKKFLAEKLGLILEGFSDSDWAGDLEKRCSTSGYGFRLEENDALICWKSALQKSVATSTAQAELVALTEAAKEAIFLRRLLSEVGFPQQGPTTIFEDNQACIAMTVNPVHHQKSKHMDIKYFFVREKVESGELVAKYIKTEDQIADLLTKPLPKKRHVRLTKIALGWSDKN